MWNVVESLKEIFRMKSVTGEERVVMDETLARLRQRPRVVKNSTHENAASGVESAQLMRKVSLFETVKQPHSRERRAVGHWCESSAAGAREENTQKIEHSYEKDFAHATHFENDSLYPFLSKAAQNKALNDYIMNSDLGRPALSPSSNHEEHTLSPVIEMKSLTEMEELLLRFAQDQEDEFSRTSVAGNEKAPIAAMWLLAADKSNDVRLALVENPNVPLAVLEVLAKDFDAKVARKAQIRIRQIASTETGIAFGNLGGDSSAEANEEITAASLKRAV